MTGYFWAGAAGLALLAWLMLALPGWARARNSPRVDGRERSNVEVLQAQRLAIDAEFAAGRIDAAERAASRADIERRVLAETARAPGASAVTASAAARPSHRALTALGLGIPVLAFGLYGFLGNLDALAPHAAAPALAAAPAAVAGANDASTEVPSQAVEAMLDDMAKRMEGQAAGTTDAAGWALLGRSYAALQRFDAAGHAYGRAIALAPGDAQLLADMADVLSMQQGRRTAGEPARLIARALQIDPDNLKALALAGSEAFERGDVVAATAHWTRARALAPPGPFADGVARNLAEVGTSAPAAPPVTAAAPGSRISGRVSVAPELAARVRPGDTVFVFARAAGGPPMPVAVARYKASDLPLNYVLDDAAVMAGGPRLSSFASVVVSARISRTGEALPQAGDLRGESQSVAPGRDGVDLAISAVQP